MDNPQAFAIALKELSKFDLIEIAKVHANSQARDGNPYVTALIREIANRYEESIPYVPKPQRFIEVDPNNPDDVVLLKNSDGTVIGKIAGLSDLTEEKRQQIGIVFTEIYGKKDQ
jgi:hypothetical protein